MFSSELFDLDLGISEFEKEMAVGVNCTWCKGCDGCKGCAGCGDTAKKQANYLCFQEESQMFTDEIMNINQENVFNPTGCFSCKGCRGCKGCDGCDSLARIDSPPSTKKQEDGSMFTTEVIDFPFEGEKDDGTAGTYCVWCSGCDGCKGCRGCDTTGKKENNYTLVCQKSQLPLHEKIRLLTRIKQDIYIIILLYFYSNYNERGVYDLIYK